MQYNSERELTVSDQKINTPSQYFNILERQLGEKGYLNSHWYTVGRSMFELFGSTSARVAHHDLVTWLLEQLKNLSQGKGLLKSNGSLACDKAANVIIPPAYSKEEQLNQMQLLTFAAAWYAINLATDSKTLVYVVLDCAGFALPDDVSGSNSREYLNTKFVISQDYMDKLQKNSQTLKNLVALCVDNKGSYKISSKLNVDLILDQFDSHMVEIEQSEPISTPCAIGDNSNHEDLSKTYSMSLNVRDLLGGDVDLLEGDEKDSSYPPFG